MEKRIFRKEIKNIELMRYFVMHGTQHQNTSFDLGNNRVVYFTNDKNKAKSFAFAVDAGGIIPGETPTIIHATINIENPLTIPSEEWEQLADITNINKAQIMEQGYDGIISDCLGCIYYVVFNKHQINIRYRERLTINKY